MPHRPYLSDSDADAILATTRSAAEKTASPMTIVIVDEGDHLTRLVRMDGCLLLSLEVAMRKASTAARMRMSTKTIAEAAAASSAILALPHVMPYPGGVPLFRDGICVGALAVSGGSPEEDEAVVQAGAEGWGPP